MSLHSRIDFGFSRSLSNTLTVTQQERRQIRVKTEEDAPNKRLKKQKSENKLPSKQKLEVISFFNYLTE